MKPSKTLLGIALFAILGVLFLAMAGFFTEKLTEERVVHITDYPDLKTAQIEAEEASVDREFTGTVVADQKAILSARLTAKVAEVLVDVGQVVKQGDILMRLESADLDARVVQTEQGLSSAQARLNVARKEYKRIQALVKKKVLSQSEFDRVESELKTAQASFKQAQAAVSEAETTFGFSMITAPFDGLITQRSVNKGDTASPGMQLLSLYNPDTLQLQANVSEAQIQSVKLGELLSYQLPTYQRQGQGEVVEITPAADNTSRSFIVKISLENQSFIYPGSYGKLIVKGEPVKIVTVPAEALYQVGQLDYVKVIQADKMTTRLVQLGANNRVRKGLAEGDTVVLQPLQYQ
jgi:RND family efflux transporter MFP subunit